MEEYKRNLAVGLTAVVGVAGLLGLMLMFGWTPELVQSGYQVRVALPNASGLHADSRVYLSGLSVGQVESVAFREPATKGVLVRVRIREDVRIPKGVVASVPTKLLGGSATLHLSVPDDAEPGQYLSRTEPALIEGRTQGMASQLGSEVRQALQRPMDRFEKLADKLETLSQEWTRVGRNVNRLVEPRDPRAVEAGEAEPNLATVVERTDVRMRQLGETLEDVQKIVGDKQMVENLRQTIAQAREASGKLSDEIDRVSDKVTGDVDALKKRYVALADDVSGAVKSMKAVTEQARAGEGTVGKLLNDPALYNNLSDAAKRIQAAVDELTLLIQKWKAEGVPVDL